MPSGSEMGDGKCCICGQQSKERQNVCATDVWTVHCPVCGNYRIEDKAHKLGFNSQQSRQRAHELSGLIRETCETGGMLHIKSLEPKDVDELLSGVVPKTAQEKADRLLQALARPLNSKHPGALVEIDPPTDYPWAYAADSNELSYYIDHLVLAELVAKREDKYLLTVKGWERVEHLRESRATSKLAFVAMPFAEELNDLYEKAIKPGVTEAGYEPIRVDREEHIGKADDYIISKIKESRFIVADLTGQRQSVYFEAGFALGMGLPIVWLCEDGDVQGLHFDIRQYNHLLWKRGEWEDLANRLRYRIDVTIGLGHTTK